MLNKREDEHLKRKRDKDFDKLLKKMFAIMTSIEFSMGGAISLKDAEIAIG